MDRKLLYQKVKNNNLEEKIKKEFGRNFTQVSSKDLEKIVCAEEYKNLYKSVKVECNNKPNNVVEKLIEVLQKKRILLNSEVEYILG